jgi:hypothetical protein
MERLLAMGCSSHLDNIANTVLYTEALHRILQDLSEHILILYHSLKVRYNGIHTVGELEYLLVKELVMVSL